MLMKATENERGAGRGLFSSFAKESGRNKQINRYFKSRLRPAPFLLAFFAKKKSSVRPSAPRLLRRYSQSGNLKIAVLFFAIAAGITFPRNWRRRPTAFSSLPSSSLLSRAWENKKSSLHASATLEEEKEEEEEEEGLAE